MHAFLLMLALPMAVQAPPSPVGDWAGTLTIQGVKLRLVLHVKAAPGGALVATVDSVDQGAMGLATDGFQVADGVMRWKLAGVPGDPTFEGKLDAAMTKAEGAFRQGAMDIPLTMERSKAPIEMRRPQEPKKPYPYAEHEVTYSNAKAGVKLAGTLTIPQGAVRVPAVVLISGSGAQDRNETVFNHKPFLVLADYLTRRGIAVLRSDDRGVGGSTGSVADSTSSDFADDALAAVAFLKTRPEIDGKRIGLMGHSEGGIVAPLAASRSRDVAFIVMLAGTGIPGDEIILAQSELIARAAGAPDAQIQRDLRDTRSVLDVVKSAKDPAEAAPRLREVLKGIYDRLTAEELKAIGPFDKFADARIAQLGGKWFRSFLSYDPRPALSKVKCPVLALNGEKDLQVPPKLNLPEIEKALKAGKNRRVTVRELPGLNHLFQPTATGAVSEYATIEETFAPSALQVIGDWVTQQAQGSKGGR